MPRPTFNEQKERDEQRGDEWPFGAIATDLAAVPLQDRTSYLPAGVVQANNVMDTNGCASRAPLNAVETKLDYFYDHGMHPAIKKWFDDNGYRVNGKFALCDAFIEILSGTTPTGNSLKAPLEAIRKNGVIPAALIPLEDGMTWEQYMNPARVTQAHNDLGQQFLRRITINYEKVPVSQFEEAVHADSLDVALSAWSAPLDGVYPKIDGGFNHAVDRVTNEIDIFDSYDPFLKRLAKDYRFFEWGYSISITAQNPYPDETIALFEVLQRFGLLAFFAEALKRLLATGGPTFGATRSAKWPAIQRAFLVEHPTCAVCGRNGSLLNPLNVHHQRPFHLHPELELDPNNLITLCRLHHFLFGHLLNWASWNENVLEDARIWADKIKTRP